MFFLKTNLLLFLHLYSGANIYYTEDHNLHTPILMSAAHSQTTAFQSFMVYADMQDAEKNPVFKTLCIKWKQLKILEVTSSLYDGCYVTGCFYICCIFITQFMISDSVWGIKLSETTDESGNTPLHVAACDGNQGAVSVFLKLIQKMQVKVANKQGKLPIHLAAESGHDA